MRLKAAEIYLGKIRIAHFRETLGLSGEQQSVLVLWILEAGTAASAVTVLGSDAADGVVVPGLQGSLGTNVVLSFIRQVATVVTR